MDKPHQPGDSEYSLICPFLNTKKSFAYGVEFGMLYAEMKVADEITNYFTASNQEQITLLANRMKWTILEMKPWGKDWFFCRMVKGFVPLEEMAAA